MLTVQHARHFIASQVVLLSSTLVSQDERPTYMKSHLLSVFPLRNEEAYARLTITEVEDTRLPPFEPFLVSREYMATVFATIVSSDELETLMTDLDEGLPVQLPVSAEEAFTAVSLTRSNFQ